MPPSSAPPIRRGVPRTWSIDPDADLLLRAMVPNARAYGLFCSELIRKEAERRAERPTLVAQLQRGTDADV